MALLSQALAAEFDAVGIVDQAVEDGVSERRIADHVVPVIDGHLACDDGGSPLIAILNDLQEITALLVAELLGPPIVEDEQVGSGERLEDLGIAAIATREYKSGEQPGQTMIGDGEVLAACLVSECAGQPALADAGGSDQQETVVLPDPVAAGELQEQIAIKAAGTAIGLLLAMFWRSGNAIRARRMLVECT